VTDYIAIVVGAKIRFKFFTLTMEKLHDFSAYILVCAIASSMWICCLGGVYIPSFSVAMNKEGEYVTFFHNSAASIIKELHGVDYTPP